MLVSDHQEQDGEAPQASEVAYLEHVGCTSSLHAGQAGGTWWAARVGSMARQRQRRQRRDECGVGQRPAQQRAPRTSECRLPPEHKERYFGRRLRAGEEGYEGG